MLSYQALLNKIVCESGKYKIGMLFYNSTGMQNK